MVDFDVLFPPRGHSSAGSLVWQSQGHEEGLQFEVLERGEMSRSAFSRPGLQLNQSLAIEK